jgi:rubrerythrin
MQYGPLADNFENPIDRFSAHIEQRLQPNMTFEEAAAAIESFQVVEPEQFLAKIGKAFNKVKNIAISVIKKGIDVAKKVATAPLRAILNKIKPLIRPMLKSLLKKGIGMLPEKYRGLAQKALRSLGLDGEVQSEASGEELFRSEVLGTYETEAEGHDILHEGFDSSVRRRFIR